MKTKWKKPTWLWDSIKRNNLWTTGVLQRRDGLIRRARKLKVIAETSQIRVEIWTFKFMKITGPQTNQLKKIFSNHIIMKLSKTKDKENLKSTKRKEICHLERNPHKAINKILIRHLTGQDRVGWYIQSAERKYSQPRIFYQAKVIVQKWRRHKDFSGQTKAWEGVQHHYTCLTRNAERISSS